MDTDLVVVVKCTIFWLNRGLRVYLDLFALNFQKSKCKYLFCTKVVQKYGCVILDSLCLKNYSELPNHSNLSNLIW